MDRLSRVVVESHSAKIRAAGDLEMSIAFSETKAVAHHLGMLLLVLKGGKTKGQRVHVNFEDDETLDRMAKLLMEHTTKFQGVIGRDDDGMTGYIVFGDVVFERKK